MSEPNGYLRAAGELLREYAGQGDPGVVYSLELVVRWAADSRKHAQSAAMREDWGTVARERDRMTLAVARFAATVAEAETYYQFFTAIDLGED